MKSGIYAIWNSVLDKIYIGQAYNIRKRWKDHRAAFKNSYHSNRYLQAAYDKYEDFELVFYVIEFCDKLKLDELEQYWMDHYKSYDRNLGYNLSPTAGSSVGYKHSEETLANWSKQRKGKKRSEQAKLAIKEGWKKRKANGPVSEETKKKLSESHIGIKRNEEFKINMSKRLMGNNHASGSKRSLAHMAALAEGRRKASRARFKHFMCFD